MLLLPMKIAVRVAVVASLAATLTLSACTTPPKPNSNPMDALSAALGVQLKMRAPVKFISHEPEIVVFARMEENVAVQEHFELYGSTYVRDGAAYLMNVEPGTYALVAAFYATESTGVYDPQDPESENVLSTDTYRNYASCELVEQTRTTVAPGEFAFMGAIVADQSMTFGEGDDCQRHFMELIEGERSGWSKFVSGERSLRLSAHERDTSPPRRAEFLGKAREHFVSTGWISVIDEALAGER